MTIFIQMLRATVAYILIGAFVAGLFYLPIFTFIIVLASTHILSSEMFPLVALLSYLGLTAYCTWHFMMKDKVFTSGVVDKQT